MYKIQLHGVIQRNMKFPTYEDARKFLRRHITQLFGGYRDSFSDLGYSIKRVA